MAWNHIEAQAYMDFYADVAAEFKRNTWGLNLDEFAFRHWRRFGQLEGRKSGPQILKGDPPKPIEIPKDPYAWTEPKQLVFEEHIAAIFYCNNPYIPEAYWKMWQVEGVNTKVSYLDFVLANPNLKPGDVPNPPLSPSEVMALRWKYTVERDAALYGAGNEVIYPKPIEG